MNKEQREPDCIKGDASAINDQLQPVLQSSACPIGYPWISDKPSPNLDYCANIFGAQVLGDLIRNV